MDESYTLKIANGMAILKANSAWGALKGLDTFSQLTYFMDVNGAQKVAIFLNKNKIFSYIFDE